MKKLITLLLFPIIFSCAPQKITTTNLHDLSSFDPESRIYALPGTRLVIQVEAVKHNFYPGPYQKYTKKFLGIEGAKSISEVNWEITDVKLFRITEPDIDQYYSVKYMSKNIEDELLHLGSNGLILSPDKIDSFQQFNEDVLDNVEEIHYKDLSISPFVNEEGRKKHNKEKAQSTQDQMPFWQKQIDGKTMEEKAFDAAKFIFKIRKRRFKLLAGQYEVFPEEQALATSIEELNKLEADYLSLFIGKTYTDTVKKIFTYTPVTGEKLQRNTLFRFSDETGFYTSSENEGIPLILVVEDLDFNGMLNELQLPLNTSEDVIYYRIPDKASVKLLYGSHELLESEVLVYQFGAIVPLCVKPEYFLLRKYR